MSFVNPDNVYETVEHPKGVEYNFNVSDQLTSSETDTTDTYTYSCACFDAPASRQDHTDDINALLDKLMG